MVAARMRAGSPRIPGSSSGAGLWHYRGDKRLLSLQRRHGTKVHLTWLRGLRSALPERDRWDWSRWNLAGVNRDPSIPCPESSGASHGPTPTARGSPRAGLVLKLSGSTSLLRSLCSSSLSTSDQMATSMTFVIDSICSPTFLPQPCVSGHFEGSLLLIRT